ncbi:1-aminocyclopropane-1-carboxylate deaminase/D-cysteine desulfhydrase [Mesonia aquimarina]|uniref:1-aminocyclopropane-1-carboxylate deaminase/D-cysteine desulfhydrase n=1 Tax=Mesonia aquimarina TaxID=1504967 RepID=UPI000EF5806E|nr:pyridoxal-phosphate dependent enzyme [Mesonia aquimarina]
MKNLFETSLIAKNDFIFKDKQTGIELWLKREDQIHPFVSGNKFRKLKYNFLEAKKEGKKKVLTFGGAYSNHIAATAAAGKIMNIQTAGIIRGEELGENISATLSKNKTLKFASDQGMELQFISRSAYREKNEPHFLIENFPEYSDVYEIPEGGTNKLALKGCEEILTEQDKDFDIIACAVGTGGTIAGIINASSVDQKILGFPALKGDFLEAEIKKLTTRNNVQLILDYHFGGYAKVDKALINFINQFKKDYAIALDPIYTGKLLFGLIDLIKAREFKENTRILAVHTGGLQGISGMNQMLAKKNMPLLI